ncbi:MAG: hypothetical protein JSS49_15610 [Planctomycetes bacterium]|nr:hypothetical protein [Planctomycetota bacterium]
MMQLSPAQRKNLSIWRAFHDEPPTVAELIRLNVRRILILSICFVGPSAIAISDRSYSVAAMGLGMFLGILLRDFGAFRATVHFWPALNDVVDWNRLDELLDKEKPPKE